MTDFESDLKHHKSSYDKQIGGSHYQGFVIQPSKFVIKNNLLFLNINGQLHIMFIILNSKNAKELKPKK